MVDTSNLPLSFWVTPADVRGRAGALLLPGPKALVPRLKKIWEDLRAFAASVCETVDHGSAGSS